MVLFKGSSKKLDEQCLTTEMFAGQNELQRFLVICALLCVPWMLLAKPIYIIWSQKKDNKYAVSTSYVKSYKFSVNICGNGEYKLPKLRNIHDFEHTHVLSSSI